MKLPARCWGADCRYESEKVGGAGDLWDGVERVGLLVFPGRGQVDRSGYRHSPICHTSLLLALSRAPVTVISPINPSSVLITPALAHIFLRRLESVNLLLLLGTLLSVGGVAMVVLGARL